MNRSGVSKFAEGKLPKAMPLTDPGKTPSAGRGRNDD
jgi:hypothetical protein